MKFDVFMTIEGPSDHQMFVTGPSVCMLVSCIFTSRARDVNSNLWLGLFSEQYSHDAGPEYLLAIAILNV